MSGDTDVVAFVEGVINLRRWMQMRTPRGNSEIAQDLLVLVAYGTLVGQPVSVKALVAELPHSEAGVRKQLALCRSEGWVEYRVHPGDGRVRVLIASRKLLDFFRHYRDATKQHLKATLT
ncbi:MAG: hypothetical protein EBU07_14360 [Betaproteobacteria bacterium]|jgi:hypothetical protein|nr:hypothetical protein [Betaproteobacteria bacterium]NBS47231.1 hypothetical protein [Betaproteobacteria bacterium]